MINNEEEPPLKPDRGEWLVIAILFIPIILGCIFISCMTKELQEVESDVINEAIELSLSKDESVITSDIKQAPEIKPEPVPEPTPLPVKQVQGYGGYAWGNCTYYIASKLEIPSNWGNAREWYYNAQYAGYYVDQDPQVGEIIVTEEGWYGHVGIVEEVKDNEIVISEMNYYGYNYVNTRTIAKNYPLIKGYISK